MQLTTPSSTPLGSWYVRVCDEQTYQPLDGLTPAHPYVTNAVVYATLLKQKGCIMIKKKDEGFFCFFFITSKVIELKTSGCNQIVDLKKYFPDLM